MISFILLFWIGFELSAPVWYFVLLGLAAILQMISYGCKMYNIGVKAKERVDMNE